MIKKIPAETHVYCDGCGSKCGTGGKSRKAEETITVNCHVLDYQGSPAANGTRNFDLCDECADTINKILNSALETLRTASTRKEEAA